MTFRGYTPNRIQAIKDLVNQILRMNVKNKTQKEVYVLIMFFEHYL